MLINQKERVKIPRDRLNNALLTLNCLNVCEKGRTANERHCIIKNLRKYDNKYTKRVC